MNAVDIAQVVTSTTAVLAFGAAVWQVRSAKEMAIVSIAQSERHNRQRTTLDYVARLGDAEFGKQLERSRSALALTESHDGHSVKARWQAFKRLSIEEQFDVVAPFNAFEELAGLYNLGHLDEEIVVRQVAHAARIVFDDIHWWVERTRERDPQRFREWEAMLGDLDARGRAAVER